jgi:hypothetical protein
MANQSMHLKIAGKNEMGQLLWKAPGGKTGTAAQWANLGAATAKKP